ncbi:unnamed protein product [Lactuca virosa]|uniref:Serine-threonine/tyrosine-protein kinase catalytic domain-containing protein n=1 Tax=Lactuca virosa TaxID=75947 RepID=A0AAU9NQU4_9ASTR|nr:unnamed protein product [Lactuca virosa]
MFMRIVFRCISLKLEDRPTMKRIIKRIEEAQDIQNQHEVAFTLATQSQQRENLESYRISLKEINSAIEDFSQEIPIGDGGYAYGPKPLISLVRRYYKKGLEKLIDHNIKDQIDDRSFYAFKELAWRCISLTLTKRPTMETIIEGIEDAMELQVSTFL